VPDTLFSIAPDAGALSPKKRRHARDLAPSPQRRALATGFETVVRIIHAVGENVGWMLGEPQAALSPDDSARMREIIGFLDEHFAPIKRDPAMKPSPTLPDVPGHAILTAIFFEEGGGVTGFI
jgi:hypothetical protein